MVSTYLVLAGLFGPLPARRLGGGEGLLVHPALAGQQQMGGAGQAGHAQRQARVHPRQPVQQGGQALQRLQGEVLVYL